jgi:hypothetical protein
VSGRDPLAALQKLAALKAQRALAELAALRSRAAETARAVAAGDAAAAETYPVAVDTAAEAQALWARRAALDASGIALHREQVVHDRAAAASADRAAEALARELGAKALAARAAASKAQADARRHERSMGVLAAIRGPAGK